MNKNSDNLLILTSIIFLIALIFLYVGSTNSPKQGKYYPKQQKQASPQSEQRQNYFIDENKFAEEKLDNISPEIAKDPVFIDAGFVKSFEILNTVALEQYCSNVGYTPRIYIDEFKNTFPKTFANSDKILKEYLKTDTLINELNSGIIKKSLEYLENNNNEILSSNNKMTKLEYCKAFDRLKDVTILQRIQFIKQNKPNMYLDENKVNNNVLNYLNKSEAQYKLNNQEEKKIIDEAMGAKFFEIIYSVSLSKYCAEVGYIPSKYITKFKNKFAKTFTNADNILKKYNQNFDNNKDVYNEAIKIGLKRMENDYLSVYKEERFTKREFCELLDIDGDSLLPLQAKELKTKSPNIYIDDN